RGYTSVKLLDEDRVTIQSLMRELGYRDAKVSVRQGVSPNGEDLIITFVVDEGLPTRIDEIDIVGNGAYTDEELKNKIPNLSGKNLSRARLRNGQRAIAEYYANQGFYDAKISFAVVELPGNSNETEKRVKVVYTLDNEGKKVFINRILVNGNEATKDSAILKAITLRPDSILRSVDIFSSEQNLYATDVFRRVTIEPKPAGENDAGRLTDVIVNVEEQAPRLIQYGGGFSTDEGPFGFMDIRHFNLFGNLYQGGARLRFGQRQQLAQIDFINPRFLRDGKNKDGIIRFAPLTFSASYQRDSTVTRFFRSALDRGTMGIVQRVDEDGNPVDIFGEKTGAPTLNRFTLSAETSRTISTKNRSIFFARYRFEDVRLYNIDSLLIKDILEPDSKIRISGFGFNFVRDTRENCSITYTILDIIEKGEPGKPCRYNASDPTKGDYLTAEYNVSVPFLGANIGFHKFQGSYYRFYTIPKLKNTTLAGRAIIGLASVFSRRQSFSSSQFPDLEGSLPISERFFAGGSTTLRGFEFESAGPRVVIVPQGTFRDANGDPVFLNPFTVPFGGNALAIVNLEARVPLSKSIRAVPFYDGGNVFRRVGDIFKKQDVSPDDVFRQNLRAVWTHTVGLGLRIKTPIGGEFAVDYGYLLNPPRFLIPQTNAPNAIYQLRQGQLHFRFAQAF
ncbi:MAG: BamA/TamA family outer membrane protein, partial [Pyrinomonadaceae bacterium]